VVVHLIGTPSGALTQSRRELATRQAGDPKDITRNIHGSGAIAPL
jgi:hypothetical protein